jgi:hypothetical protein
VTVTVKIWLGLIGVTINGEFDVDEGAKSEVDMEWAGVFSVGAGIDETTSVGEGTESDDIVVGADCCVGYAKPPPNLDVS